MNPQTLWIFVAALVAVIVVGALVALAVNRRRRESLRTRFGSEYDRTVEATGSRSSAERELAQREKEVSKLDIRPLTASDRDGFRHEWDRIESRFLGQPTTAVAEAEELIDVIMRSRGYQSGDFDTRVTELSVHYPHQVEGYRKAHRLIEGGERTTEELRQAMLDCRKLVDQLLGSDDVVREIVSEREVDREVDRSRLTTPSEGDRGLRR